MSIFDWHQMIQVEWNDFLKGLVCDINALMAIFLIDLPAGGIVCLEDELGAHPEAAVRPGVGHYLHLTQPAVLRVQGTLVARVLQITFKFQYIFASTAF